ncbi:MAG: hypothetical protein JRN52_13710 [Nitrososphaerota archaeon]|nr:hypothetical protein [Nitrososphaerota archaeon]
MQAQIGKGALLEELRTKITSSTMKEATPFGSIVEHNLVGEATGVFSARHTETITVFFKHDRAYEWDTKFSQTTNEGDFIVGTGHGTGKMTGPNSHEDEGEVLFMTQSPRLSWLNNKKARIESTGDMKTGETYEKIFAL